MQTGKPRIPFWLIIIYILAAATILMWPLFAFMSVFAFDSPGSAQNPAIYTTVILILAYPLLPVVGVPGSFQAYRKGRRKLAYILAGVGALPFVAVILILVVIMVMNVVFLLRGNPIN